MHKESDQSMAKITHKEFLIAQEEIQRQQEIVDAYMIQQGHYKEKGKECQDVLLEGIRFVEQNDPYLPKLISVMFEDEQITCIEYLGYAVWGFTQGKKAYSWEQNLEKVASYMTRRGAPFRVKEFVNKFKNYNES